MTGGLLILTGAPEADRLDWNTPDLLQTFQESIAIFTRLQPQPPPQSSTAQQQDRSVLDLAAWRSLPLRRTHVPTGFSQQHDLHFVNHFPSSADFLTTASISFDAASQGDIQGDEEPSRILAEFYEHSLAVHHDMASPSWPVPHSQSQKSGVGAGAGAETSFTTSDMTTTNNTTSFTSDEDTTATILVAGDKTLTAKTPLRYRGGTTDHHLSDLEDVPPASYLLSIQPQTMTVTLIVGIISIASPKTVETRYGATRTLVEVLVGDETKSGFSVTFWLSDGAAAGSEGEAGGVLAGLRSQDVVLMQNVALNVFRGKVYGGSLRRGMTKVFLLYRMRRLGADDDGGHYSNADMATVGEGRRQHPQLEKTGRVRDWVLKFVGGGTSVVARPDRREKKGKTRKGKKRAPYRDWNQPPPLDSQ